MEIELLLNLSYVGLAGASESDQNSCALLFPLQKGPHNTGIVERVLLEVTDESTAFFDALEGAGQ